MTGFARTFGRPDAPLHVAAHSHHPWPDLSYDAQLAAWNDAARLLDRKWDHIYAAVFPAAQQHIARQLSLPDPGTIAFGLPDRQLWRVVERGPNNRLNCVEGRTQRAIDMERLGEEPW